MESNSKTFLRAVFFNLFRDDNHIKNRFYGLVRKSIRHMCRYSNVKTTVLGIYDLKPATISHIFSQGLKSPKAED